MERGKLWFVGAVFAALALWPLPAGSYGIDLVTKIMVYAIFALSLELLVGGAGLVCFGPAAFFGVGAYAAVLLSPAEGASISWLLPACVAAAALYALADGVDARGGLFGARIRFVGEDDRYKPEETLRLLETVARRDRPLAFVNLLGSADVAAVLKDGLLDRLAVPAIGVTPGAQNLRRPGQPLAVSRAGR